MKRSNLIFRIWFDRDLLVTLFSGALLFFVLQQFDAFEKIYQLTRNYEEYELDEFVLFIFAAPIPVIWLTIRRTKRLVEQFKLRLESEQRIEAYKRMNSLGVLAGGIAHELGNQLLPIVTMSELLKNSMPETSADRRKVELIYSSSRKAQETVEKVLSFAHHEQDQIASCNLSEVVNEAFELVSITRPRRIILELDVEKNLGTVDLPEKEIQGLIVNLVTNSFDSIGAASGKVEVAIKKVTDPNLSGTTFTESSTTEFIAITVRDNGRGMSKEVKEQALEPFFTTKPVGQGTGLGLAQVYGLVKYAKGEIQIETQANKGCAITVLLPHVAD